MIWYYTPSLNIMSVCLCLVSWQYLLSMCCRQCWSFQCWEHHQHLFLWFVKLNALLPLRCTIIKCPRFPNKPSVLGKNTYRQDVKYWSTRFAIPRCAPNRSQKSTETFPAIHHLFGLKCFMFLGDAWLTKLLMCHASYYSYRNVHEIMIFRSQQLA